MPTYEYQCTSCKHRFEQFQSMKDKPLRKCPECGKNTLERLIGTGAAVIFKGSGFYQTDYRSESYKKGAESESKPASETKSDSKSESKTEGAKTETKAEPAKKADPAPKTESKPKKPGKKG